MVSLAALSLAILTARVPAWSVALLAAVSGFSNGNAIGFGRPVHGSAIWYIAGAMVVVAATVGLTYVALSDRRWSLENRRISLT